MDLIELEQLQGVAASSVATLATDRLIGRSLHALVFQRGGGAFTNAHLSSIMMRVDGKEVVKTLTGAQLVDINEYEGLVDVTNYTVLPFGDMTARTIRGQHLGDIDFSIYPKPLELEVSIGAATTDPQGVGAVRRPQAANGHRLHAGGSRADSRAHPYRADSLGGGGSQDLRAVARLESGCAPASRVPVPCQPHGGGALQAGRAQVEQRGHGAQFGHRAAVRAGAAVWALRARSHRRRQPGRGGGHGARRWSPLVARAQPDHVELRHHHGLRGRVSHAAGALIHAGDQHHGLLAEPALAGRGLIVDAARAKYVDVETRADDRNIRDNVDARTGDTGAGGISPLTVVLVVAAAVVGVVLLKRVL